MHKLVRLNGFLFKILRIIWLTLDPTCVLVGFLYDPPDPYADPGLVMAQEHDVLSGPNELSGPLPDRMFYKVSQPLLALCPLNKHVERSCHLPTKEQV